MPEMAEKIYRELKRHCNVFYDEKGAIGRRYRRQDEAGTPFCITVDSQSLTDGTVTFRDRDSCRQWRVAAGEVVQGARRLARRSADPRCVLSPAAPRERPEEAISHDPRSPGPAPIMKPCISQATTLMNPFRADVATYHGGGWRCMEVWLTKLESFVEENSVAEARDLLKSSGLRRGGGGAGGVAAVPGRGEVDPLGPFRRRLLLLNELGIETMIIAADHAGRMPRRSRISRSRPQA